jgi:hypothetical protein
MKKTYVVTLDNCSRRKPQRDKLIIRASSPESAVTQARAINTRVVGKYSAVALEADPVTDLGCCTKAEVLAMHKIMRGTQ